MAATTTYGAIRDQMIAKIQAITPTVRSDELFARSHTRLPLRIEATSSSAFFRKFEIVRTGATEQPPHMDGDSVYRIEEATISVAYPAVPGAAGEDEIDDLEDLIRKDAKLIHDVIFSAGNYVSGQDIAVPVIQPVEMGEGVWFQDIVVRIQYRESMTLV